MTKYFILNIVLNLAIVFLAYCGFEGYKAGNMLVTGLSIAFLVVLIYLKVVLSKRIKSLSKKRIVKKNRNTLLSKQREKINSSEFLTYHIQKEQKTIVFCSFLYYLHLFLFYKWRFRYFSFNFLITDMDKDICTIFCKCSIYVTQTY